MHADQHLYDADEPVRGLPARLPAGEHMLWQGSPSWKTFARHTCRADWIAGYFAVMLVWYAISGLYDGQALADLAIDELRFAGLAAFVFAVVAVFSIAVARTTVYTITSRRVVIRVGMALAKTINLPFARLATASAEVFADGHGNIELTPMAEDRIAYILLWPHLRGFTMSRAIPVLRAVPKARQAAAILGEALAQYVQTESPVAETVSAATPPIRPTSRPAQSGGVTAAA